MPLPARWLSSSAAHSGVRAFSDFCRGPPIGKGDAFALTPDLLPPLPGGLGSPLLSNDFGREGQRGTQDQVTALEWPAGAHGWQGGELRVAPVWYQ